MDVDEHGLGVKHGLGAPWWELSCAGSPVSLRRLVLQLQKIIHTDVWAWRSETHRRARDDNILTLPPHSKSYEPIFDFFQKMRRLFLVRYWKSRKNQAISLFDICEKHEGRAKSAPPPFPGAGFNNTKALRAIHARPDPKSSLCLQTSHLHLDSKKLPRNPPAYL